MAYSAVLRCLIVCFAFGALVSASKLQESKLLQKSTGHRLERLKNELLQAKKNSIQSDAKDDAESQIKNLLAAIKLTNRTASKEPVKLTNRTASKEPVKLTNRTASKTSRDDLTALQELFEETDLTAPKQPVKVTNRTASKEPVKLTNRTASKTSRDDLTALQELFEETDLTAPKQPVKVTNRTASKEPVKLTNRTASKTSGEDLTALQELFEETDLTAPKQPVKVTNRTASKVPVKLTNRTASKTSREELTALQELFEETDLPAPKQPVKVTNRTASKVPVKLTNRTAPGETVKVTNRTALKAPGDDDDNENDDGEDNEDEDDDSIYFFDTIFYHAAALADEIKTQCDIDIAAIYESYSPVTLKDMNDAQANLLAATQKLSTTLSAAPGFADDLKSFLDSNEYSDAKVADNIEKTMAKIDKTLTIDHKQIFCAEARIIAARLQMSLYGGIGFVNGYLCNKFSVELGQYGSDAAKLLKAVSDDKNFLKEYTSYFVEDIECYEKELEAFQKVVPVTQLTAESPLQVAAFTSDFLIDYGGLMLYHRIILETEAIILGLCASGGDDGDDADGDNDNDVEKDAADEKSLTNQLYKLLTKLQEVSAKKAAAEAALRDRAGSSMPVRGEKSFLKESYYRKRVNN